VRARNFVDSIGASSNSCLILEYSYLSGWLWEAWRRAVVSMVEVESRSCGFVQVKVCGENSLIRLNAE
jgi:hypothetical protein